jgi:hypothetical protein
LCIGIVIVKPSLYVRRTVNGVVVWSISRVKGGDVFSIDIGIDIDIGIGMGIGIGTVIDNNNGRLYN